uniref:GRIP1 associated protein 1 n=1 Tax=Gadus morhua TaxID=8049 RepID=A0A8C5CA79_GADMO
MAQALSEEEFHRMQAQLLELRTQNYQLSDDLRKNSAELGVLRQKTGVLERDLGKAQKVNYNMSGHVTQQEVDALLGETAMLQGKLHSQEEDFRLQNSTLIAELSKLCTQIEQLEQDNQRLKEVGGASLLRVQAENSALQNKMAGVCSSFHIHACLYPYACVHMDVRVYPLPSLVRTKIDEINQKKEDDLKSLNLRIQKLQTDLGAANQTMAEMREQLLGKEKEHEVALHTLRDQIQTVKTQEVNLLREQQGALSAELQQRRAEQESLLAQRDDLTSQIQEASFASRRLLEQLSEESQEKERLQRELEDSRKTAEKRKVMLDDVATQLNQEKSGHKEVLSDLKLQQEKEVLAVRARYEKELRGLHEEKNRCEEELKQQLRDEKARSKDLELCQQTVEELQAEVRTKEESRDCLERRLGDAEVRGGRTLGGTGWKRE